MLSQNEPLKGYDKLSNMFGISAKFTFCSSD